MTAAEGAAIGVDREYETIYVIRPDAEKKRAEDVFSRMTDVIGKGGGRLTRVENWGRRLLAYPVERHKRGVYVYFKYIGQGALVSEIERNLRMLDAVIKFQTVKVAELVSAAEASVSDEDVRFEHVEPPEEGEEEDVSFARSLGLEPGSDARTDARDGRDDEGDADAAPDAGEDEAAGSGEEEGE